jgi:hypothetical protein
MTIDSDYREFESRFDGQLTQLFLNESDPEVKECIRQCILKVRLIARDRWHASGHHELTRIHFEEPE